MSPSVKVKREILCAGCGCLIESRRDGEQRSLCDACEDKIERSGVNWAGEKQAKN